MKTQVDRTDRRTTRIAYPYNIPDNHKDTLNNALVSFGHLVPVGNIISFGLFAELIEEAYDKERPDVKLVLETLRFYNEVEIPQWQVWS